MSSNPQDTGSPTSSGLPSLARSLLGGQGGRRGGGRGPDCHEVSPKRVGTLHTDTQTCGLINRTCIIALATASPGTTIVISCAGTRDSDRLAPWEWAAGCIGPASYVAVCLLGWSALLPPWLAAWAFLFAAGIVPVGQNHTTHPPTTHDPTPRVCFCLA